RAPDRRKDVRRRADVAVDDQVGVPDDRVVRVVVAFVRDVDVGDRRGHGRVLELHPDVAEPVRVDLRVPTGLDARAPRVATAGSAEAGADPDDDAAVVLTAEVDGRGLGLDESP